MWQNEYWMSYSFLWVLKKTTTNFSFKSFHSEWQKTLNCTVTELLEGMCRKLSHIKCSILVYTFCAILNKTIRQTFVFLNSVCSHRQHIIQLQIHLIKIQYNVFILYLFTHLCINVPDTFCWNQLHSEFTQINMINISRVTRWCAKMQLVVSVCRSLSKWCELCLC